ncbi:MAG: sugar-binding protein [Planctomycetota bacterium]
MKRIAMLCLLALAVAAGSAAAADEAPVTITDAQVDAIVADAPACPIAGQTDLDLRLIDYIDCGDDSDPHDRMDQGTSRVVMDPTLGFYRETAPHRHAFFAYRFRSAGKDKPVLIVFEYPDNATRTINFSTHESPLSGRSNADWSLETGVYTGDPLPVSNAMQYHTFIMWPRDQWPVAMVGNFHRYGHRAAASRIWVYAIEGELPDLDVEAPDPADQRKLGHFNSFAFLPTAFHFGYRSPNAIEHMLDYAEYVGVNELAWCVLANNSWGAWADVPSWPSTGNNRDHLDKVLSAMDRRGGFSFAACMGPESNVTFGGKQYADMTPDELREACFTLFDEFLDRYGEYDSLRAIGLGSQYGIHFAKHLAEAAVLDDVVAHIKAQRPDLQVFVFTGGLGLHIEYFGGRDGGPTARDVLAAFEEGDKTWDEVLGEMAQKAWAAWDQVPADFKDVEGLDVYEQYQPDDHRIFPLYAHQPRSMSYYDLDRSAARSAAVDTPYAAMWNTHFEGWYGLHPEVNFWYRKLWVAPDFNAPPPRSLASFARILGHQDRLVIMPGSWNNKYFGHEIAMRRFAKAYRSLPPVEMADVPDVPLGTVKVRWVRYEGKRYVSVQSLIPFASQVTVDDRTVELGPYELAALVDDGTAAPTVAGTAPSDYRWWVGERILKATRLLEQVKALDEAAAPEAYAGTIEQATEHLTQGRPYAADRTLGAGLVAELELRHDILDPPTLTAYRLSSPPPMDGNLDAWPDEAANILADSGEHLAGHLYFPNSWEGPADLSARIRLGYDDESLYIGAHIRDDVLMAKDACAFRLSTDGAYRDWDAASATSNLTWTISLPVDGEPTAGTGGGGFTYTCRRTADGYVVEGTASLAELGLAPGDAMGWLLFVTDLDGQTPNLKEASWAAEQAMLVPHQPNFVYWSDARTCGRLRLAE